MDQVKFALRIKEARKERGWTQKELRWASIWSNLSLISCMSENTAWAINHCQNYLRTPPFSAMPLTSFFLASSPLEKPGV